MASFRMLSPKTFINSSLFGTFVLKNMHNDKCSQSVLWIQEVGCISYICKMVIYYFTAILIAWLPILAMTREAEETACDTTPSIALAAPICLPSAA